MHITTALVAMVPYLALLANAVPTEAHSARGSPRLGDMWVGPIVCATQRELTVHPGKWHREVMATKDCCHWAHQDVGDNRAKYSEVWKSCKASPMNSVHDNVNKERMTKCCKDRGTTAIETEHTKVFG